MSAREHCALARANRVFGTDKKRIRTKNTVMNKGNNGLRLHSDNKRNPATAAGAPCRMHYFFFLSFSISA